MAKKTVTLTFYSDILFEEFKDSVIQELKDASIEHHQSVIIENNGDDINISFYDVDEE